MNEYYEFLGLDETATDEEITNRYEDLKAEYSEDRWLDGEEGNEAAKNLTKLETAYREVMMSRMEHGENTDGDDAYEAIAALLKQDKVAEAQTKLDEFNERGAEWHYLQAVVFYKKNWSSDSKKQLEIAMQMDPDNRKYKEAYGKLNAKNEYRQQSAHQQQTQNPYTNTDPVDHGQMGGNACTDCMTCCYANLCINCLFNLCCGCR